MLSPVDFSYVRKFCNDICAELRFPNLNLIPIDKQELRIRTAGILSSKFL